MKLTVSQVAPLVAQVTGVCETNSKVYSYINQACRRLLYSGLWAGCYGRFTIYPSSGCITWPRAIETIESVSTCCSLGTVRNQWYEFQEAGYGLLDSDPAGVGQQLTDRGTVCAYRDMSGELDSYIRVYAGDLSDVGRTITLQGYDQNGAWIRTQVNGVWIDGEMLTQTASYVQSTKKFTALVGVQRQTTNTVSRLYEYNVTSAAETDIAVYDPDEILPEYRRSFLTNWCSETPAVTVMAKLRHIPVSSAYDYVIPPSADAIKLMAQAIRASDNNLLSESLGYEAKAIELLQKQTQHVIGDAVSTIRMVGAEVNGGGIPLFM